MLRTDDDIARSPQSSDETRIKEFINHLQHQFSSLPQHDEHASVLVVAESALSFSYLNQLLDQQLAQLTLSSAKISFDGMLNCLREFLARRWEMIQKTDCVYTFNPNSKINQACLMLANQLSKHLPVVGQRGSSFINRGIHPYELLMPSITNIMSYFPDLLPHELRLHHFILRDNGTPISILRVRDFLERDYIPISKRPAPSGDRISPDEEKYFKEHSVAAANYFAAVIAYGKFKSPHRHAQLSNVVINADDAARRKEDELLSKKLSDAYEALQDYLAHDKLPNRIASTYDVTGQHRLLKVIISEFKSCDEFINFFAHKLPRPLWRSFASHIVDVDYFKIMLRVDTADKIKIELARLFANPHSLLNHSTIKVPQFMPGEQGRMALTAYFYCLLNCYRREREAEPQNSSYFGFIYGAPSKADKLAICKVTEDLLLSIENIVEFEVELKKKLDQESKKSKVNVEAIDDARLGVYMIVVKNVISQFVAAEELYLKPQPTLRKEWMVVPR